MTTPPSPLSQIEESIRQRLNTALNPGFPCDILPFPADPEQIGLPAAHRQIFLGFKRSRFSPPAQTQYNGPILQVRTLEYEILIKSKDLRVHEGSYAIAQEILYALTNYQPHPQAKPLYPIEEGFVGLSQAIWGYSMLFACSLPFTKR